MFETERFSFFHDRAIVTLTWCWISFGRQIEHKLWPHLRMKTFPSKISMQTGHFKWSGFILDFSLRFFFLKYFTEFGLLYEVGFCWMSRMNRILKNEAVELKIFSHFPFSDLQWLICVILVFSSVLHLSFFFPLSISFRCIWYAAYRFLLQNKMVTEMLAFEIRGYQNVIFFNVVGKGSWEEREVGKFLIYH